MTSSRAPILLATALWAALGAAALGQQGPVSAQVRVAVEPEASADRTLATAEQLSQLRAQAQVSLERRDWTGAIAAAQRFVKAGGAEADVRPLLVQAYLHIEDYANVARELQWDVKAAERAGHAPAEDRLLLLQSCYARLNDVNAYSWVLEKLVTWYPKKEYWSELLDRTEKRPDFGEPLALDVNRLRLAAGAMNGAQAWLDYAAQAEAAGYPAEAKAVIERGMARGALGVAADAQKHRLLLQQYTAAARAQQQRLSDPHVEAAADKAKDGVGLVDVGYAYVTLGNYERGIALMERGIRKDPWLAGKPQVARLHLGVAYYLAGDKARAAELFKRVGGKHGGADLGRMWAIQAQRAQ